MTLDENIKLISNIDELLTQGKILIGSADVHVGPQILFQVPANHRYKLFLAYRVASSSSNVQLLLSNTAGSTMPLAIYSGSYQSLSFAGGIPMEPGWSMQMAQGGGSDTSLAWGAMVTDIDASVEGNL